MIVRRPFEIVIKRQQKASISSFTGLLGPNRHRLGLASNYYSNTRRSVSVTRISNCRFVYVTFTWRRTFLEIN